MASRIGALLHRNPFSGATPADAPPGTAASPQADPVAAVASVPALRSPPPARTVRMGDLVIVYEGFNKQKAVTLTEKGQYQNRYGSFPHREWVGKPFGAKVYCKGEGKGFVWLLAPTPELWTKVLPHRTQILYAPDISLVAHALELKPGSVVLESGTGSASLTHALIRSVAPTGHVYTFEFNRARAEAANREILEHGLEKQCTVSHRDVERDGFPACLESRCDAVFLDLPGPWKVVPSAARALRPDGVLCAFSPCIEQVQRTCEALEARGFGDAQTVELLGREHDVETRDMQRSLARSQPKLQNKWQREAKQKAKRKRAGASGGDGDAEPLDPEPLDVERVVSYPRQQAQSHTGYLTFARLVPYATAEEAAAARAAGRARRRGRNGGGEENDDEFSE